MTDEVMKTLTTGPTGRPVFFIDSLNAIASDLRRRDVYRLLTLFRSKGIAAFLTAELWKEPGGGGGSISEDARFLADIVLELTFKESAGHLLHYLEISKSRVRRQALGKHLYKIRTRERRSSGILGSQGETESPTAAQDPRAGDPRSGEPEAGSSPFNTRPQKPEFGFLVYPSLPSIVSMARSQPGPEVELCYRLFNRPDGPDSIHKLMQTYRVKAGECFSLVGPAGTHKLALGLNLATGYRRSKGDNDPKPCRNLLIIAFGSYKAVNLEGVAWFGNRKRWSRCRAPKEPKDPKWERVDFDFGDSREDDADGPAPQASQLTLRMGHLTPEECFYQIQKEIEDRDFSSVLLWDTAQISTGFPLLRSEPLFLPSLIDLFHEKGLVSVFIGVREAGGPNREMDFDLESAADYRLSLSHFPSAYDLAKGIYRRAGSDGWQAVKLDEQLVSVVLDNVTGKHYGRHPKWLMVEEDEKDKAKTLFCLEMSDCILKANQPEEFKKKYPPL